MAGVAIGRSAIPGWSGAPAGLSQAVTAVAVLVLTAELLGAVGEFRRWPLAGATAAIGTVSLTLGRPQPTRRRRSKTPRSSRPALAIGAVATATIATGSVQAAGDAFHAGMLSYDTLWYHLPFAARFVQVGSITHLHYVGNDPTTFYPANGELVHAMGMLLFRWDLLSPVVNIGWLALALVAGWCVGRPYRVAPATMLATCLVTFLPVMGGAQAGTAGTDVAVLALLVSAVALVVNGGGARAPLAIAALAGGLAAGTKLDAWATVVALGLVAVVLHHGRRRNAAFLWIGGVVVGSAFWYLRNLADVGNPFPWFGATGAPVDCGTRSLAHYVTRPGYVSAHLLPQLPGALGARWWLVVGLAAAGAAAGLGSRSATVRGLALVGLVSAAAYVVTPATAGGHEARCFAFNTRFATPALALGMIVLPVALSSVRLGPVVSVVALIVVAALNIHPSHRVPVLLAVGALAALALVGARRTVRLPAKAAIVVAIAGALIAAGWHEQRAYARDRYTTATFSDPIASVVRRLRSIHGARIAVSGFSETYPLYGADLSNRVVYPARRRGARFMPYSSCGAWLDALRAGGYEYVVTAREGTVDSASARWTRRYPGARELLRSTPGATTRGARWTWQLFRIDPSIHVAAARACADGK